ncbi:MAG: NTP transferase domain-containing protein [Jatrophihabitantaceae bacterium]
MDETAGWRIDPGTLDPVLTDRRIVEAALASADPVDRLRLLPLLGRGDQALAEAGQLIEQPAVREDPWRVLLLTSDLHRWRHELDQAERLLTAAWKFARSRGRQASSLQRLGKCWFRFGDLDRAGACFELALTMRRGFAPADQVASSEQAIGRVRQRLGFDAIVLAGGQGRRLRGSGAAGIAKATLPLAGWPLVDHVLLAASGATNRIVAGPKRIALASPQFCREDPAGSGPVAAIAAALHLVRQPVVAVLAADLPFIGPALSTLRDCVTLGPRQAAVLVDTTGQSNYLASMWQTAALHQALDRLGEPANRPVRELYRDLDVARAPDYDANGADCDTPDDLAIARERVSRRNPGQLPAALLAWPWLELHAPS